jgi:GNAT superfamily N-acetyltransferase
MSVARLTTPVCGARCSLIRLRFPAPSSSQIGCNAQSVATHSNFAHQSTFISAHPVSDSSPASVRQFLKHPVNEGLCIRRATEDRTTAEALADVLLDCVEGGASIGFMHPLSRAKAVAFWEGVLASASRGERIVLVAEDTVSQSIVGTVQLILTMPDNQPHRADVAKMQVHRSARRRGVGASLLRAIEAEARSADRTLLVLDTVTGSDAERLYSSLGWQRSGIIPDYALWPEGGLCSTTIFYRQL